MLANWPSYFPEVPAPSAIRYLGIPGSPEGGTATFIALGEPGGRPLFAVKVHRGLHEKERVRNETDALSLLHAQGGELAASVPRVIYAGLIGCRWVLVQSMLKGRPMSTLLDTAGRPDIEEAGRHFALASEWICRVHEGTQKTSAKALASVRWNLVRAISDFDCCFALSGEERAALKRLEEGIDDLLRVGLVLQHGDFCRHNILVGDRRHPSIGVIDWTFARLLGLPFHDLFFFFSGYFSQVRRDLGPETFLRIFEYTFLERNSYSKLVKLEVERYCGRLRLDLNQVADWFTIFLVEQAVFELRQTLVCAREFGLPRFVVYLGSAAGRAYTDALTEQIWFRYFRRFVADRSAFIV